jgi:hypothetical protein
MGQDPNGHNEWHDHTLLHNLSELSAVLFDVALAAAHAAGGAWDVQLADQAYKMRSGIMMSPCFAAASTQHCSLGGWQDHVSHVLGCTTAAVLAGVLCDMHLLQLSNLTWVEVDLGNMVQPLCRHQMVITSQHVCCIFGGYDGSSSCSTLMQVDLQPVLQLQRSSLQDLTQSMACSGAAAPNRLRPQAGGEQQQSMTADKAQAADGEGKTIQPPIEVLKVMSKKAIPAPLRLDDLPNAAEVIQLPQWKQVRVLHQVIQFAGVRGKQGLQHTITSENCMNAILQKCSFSFGWSRHFIIKAMLAGAVGCIVSFVDLYLRHSF